MSVWQECFTFNCRNVYRGGGHQTQYALAQRVPAAAKVLRERARGREKE